MFTMAVKFLYVYIFGMNSAVLTRLVVLWIEPIRRWLNPGVLKLIHFAWHAVPWFMHSCVALLKIDQKLSKPAAAFKRIPFSAAKLQKCILSPDISDSLHQLCINVNNKQFWSVHSRRGLGSAWVLLCVRQCSVHSVSLSFCLPVSASLAQLKVRSCILFQPSAFLAAYLAIWL